MNGKGIVISVLMMISSVNIIFPVQPLTADEEQTVKMLHAWYKRELNNVQPVAPFINIGVTDTDYIPAFYIPALEKENKLLKEQIRLNRGLFYGYIAPGGKKLIAIGAGLASLAALGFSATAAYNVYNVWTQPNSRFDRVAVWGIDWFSPFFQGRVKTAESKAKYLTKYGWSAESNRTAFGMGTMGLFTGMGSLALASLYVYATNNYNNYQKKRADIIQTSEERIALNEKIIERLNKYISGM